MPTSKREIVLAAFLFPPGSFASGWRMPDARPNSDMDIQSYIHLAKTAERGKLDMMFLQDSSATQMSTQIANGEPISGKLSRCVRLDPLALMSAVAAVTSRIGLVATATTTYNEPYHVARKFLTLDHISQGRAGWNLVTTQNLEEAGNFGLDSHVEHALRYERAAEFHDVVAGLWDSWEDDAVVNDKERDRYRDDSKVHRLNHHGKHFSVRGPLDVPRSPQGRPIIAQAGSSEPGKELAARTADVVFTAQGSAEESAVFYKDVKDRMAKYGREPDELKILPGLNFMVARTESEAQELYDIAASLTPIENAMRGLKRHSAGVDLSQYPLDGPLPELPVSNSSQSRQQVLVNLARTKGWTIRQLAAYFSLGNGHNVLYGTPAHIADVMEDYVAKGGADGFTLISPYLSTPIERFVDLVVPELQRRGLFRKEYAGRTLRDHLGLKRPPNALALRAAAE